jgi:uncharacterized protein involved in exopolysaccharide biosynthesis
MNVIAIRPRSDDNFPPSDEGGELGTFSLKWIFSFLVRRWILIAAIGLVAFILCFAAFLMQRPQYTATALLMINAGQDRVLAPDQMVAGSEMVPAQVVDSQLEVLRSEMLAGRLVDALDLVNDPEWNGLLRRDNAPPAATTLPAPDNSAAAAARAQVRQNVIANVKGAIAVRRRGLTYAAEVAVTSENPQRAAQMANRLVDLFQQYQLEARLASANSANSWLATRVRELRDDVQTKEAVAERYRAQTGLLSSQGELLTEQQTTELQQTLSQARADLAE